MMKNALLILNLRAVTVLLVCMPFFQYFIGYYNLIIYTRSYGCNYTCNCCKINVPMCNRCNSENQYKLG